MNVWVAILAAILALNWTPAYAQAGAVATGVVVDQIGKEIDTALEKAKEVGDYVGAVALARAKDALDAWKKTNSDLLDKAFGDLDKASQENFGRIRSLVADVDRRLPGYLDAANALADRANQLVADLPGGRPYISRFQPRVVPITATSVYRIRVSGVSLDTADAELILPDGVKAARTVIGPQEVQFEIPLAATPRGQGKMVVHALKVKYSQPKKGFVAWALRQREVVERQLPIVAMPTEVATFVVEGSRKFEKRVSPAAHYENNMGQFKKTDGRIYRLANPQEGGWKWDVSDRSKFEFKAYPNTGNKGRCEGIDWNGSSENAIRVYAHCDKIGPNRQYPTGAPGRVNCYLKGPIYRMEPTTEPFSRSPVALSWKDDKVVEIPVDTNALKITAKTFDGRTRIFSGTDSDKFFEVRRAGSTLTLVPRVPDDIVALQ